MVSPVYILIFIVLISLLNRKQREVKKENKTRKNTSIERNCQQTIKL